MITGSKEESFNELSVAAPPSDGERAEEEDVSRLI